MRFLPDRTTLRTPLLERLFTGHHDVLAALRSLRRSPGFVAIAVLSLGLAIALNTTTFAMLDAIRTPYVPYRDPGSLVEISNRNLSRHPTVTAREMYLAMRDRSDLFATLMPVISHGTVIEANGRVEYGSVAAVGRGAFDVWGVQPIVGRVFRHGAARAVGGGVAPAVISSMVWHVMLGSDRQLERLKVSIDGVSHPVIGVMPPTMAPSTFQVWLPMADDSVLTLDGIDGISAVARLRPGWTEPQVKAQLDQVAARMARESREPRNWFDYRLTSLQPEPGTLRGSDRAMGTVALLVLLVACLNLANLMLARGIGRRRETAVRMALGAGGAAIMRYVLAECAVLAGLGGSWGVLLSLWGVKLVQRNMPAGLTEFGFVAPHVSWRIVAFGVAVTGATVFLVGLIPALRARRTNVNEAMKDGGASSTGRRSRSYSLLVIGEAALSLIVLMAAGLLIRGAQHESGRTWGYDVDHVLTAGVNPTGPECDASPHGSFLADLAAHAAAVPQVRYAAARYWKRADRGVVTSDMPGLPQRVMLGYDRVTPGYLRTMGVRITAGRDFEPGDAQGPPVAIVGSTTAAQFWPLQSPLGRMLKLGPARSSAPWVQVVGVVGAVDPLTNKPGADAAQGIYVSAPMGCHNAVVLVRVTGEDPTAPAAVYNALRAAISQGYVGAVEPPNIWYERELASRWLIAALFSAVGAFALVLTAVGVFGVLSYSVRQRTREFAMRIALGAGRRDLFKLVWHDALVMTLAGTGIGAFGALWFGHFLGEYWLNHVQPTDVWALIGAEAVLVVVSLVSCLGPVRQATRADPVDLLRST